MSIISAIDTSTVAPRSAEASNIAGKEQQLQQHVVDSGANSFHKTVEQNQQRTVEAKKSETADYDSEGSGAGGYRGQKKKKKKSAEVPMAPRSNSNFDITI